MAELLESQPLDLISSIRVFIFVLYSTLNVMQMKLKHSLIKIQIKKKQHEK